MKKQQISTTRQRGAILDALRGVVTHPTADELHRMVRQTMPNVSLGTVYRNLEIMSERGLVTKLNTAGPQMRFDGDTRPHYHVRCSRCGRVDDVAVEPVDGIDQAAGQASGYAITSHSIEFEGICPDCASGGNSEKDST